MKLDQMRGGENLMRYRVYHHNTEEWVDVKASATQSFLLEHRFLLRSGLVRSSISLLKNNGNNSAKYPVPLTLGLCKIENVTKEESAEVIQHLKFALENYIKF